MKIRSSNLVAISAVLGAAWAVFAFAAGGIEFPVRELGDCADAKACRAYCDQPDNMEACAAFAERHRMADAQASERAGRLAAALKSGGPGKCTTASWCQAYCTKPAHAEECVAFARKHGLSGAERSPSPSVSASPSPSVSIKPSPRSSPSASPTRDLKPASRPSETPINHVPSLEEMEKLHNSRGLFTNLPEPAPERHSQSLIMTFFHALTYYLIGR